MSFRCTAASLERSEPMAGTASTVEAFLLVEWPGGWGVHATRDSRLPREVRDHLAGLRGVRPLLIRRGRTSAHRVFLARGGVLTTATLGSVRDLLQLDLGRDLSAHPGDLFLVCTHGRHDVCCAERGRPLWHALTAVAPEQTWQVSHIGGDRFAPNVLVLPQGLYYGRLDPTGAELFVARHAAGEVDLDHLRGRCAYPFPAQAAEVFLRRELGVTALDAVRLLSSDATSATFDADGRRWHVVVQRTDTRAVLTCRAGSPSAGWTFGLVSVRDLDA